MSDPRTPAERRYDAERDGTLYTIEPLIDLDPLADEDAEYSEASIGTIAGCAVTGLFKSGVLFYATLTWDGLRISSDGEQFVSIPLEEGESVGDIALADWQRLKRLASSGIVEQLIALVRPAA